MTGAVADVLRLNEQGHSEDEIADTLGISVRRVIAIVDAGLVLHTPRIEPVLPPTVSTRPKDGVGRATRPKQPRKKRAPNKSPRPKGEKPPCGTTQGYYWHLAHTKADGRCDPCWDAIAKDRREKNRLKAEAEGRTVKEYRPRGEYAHGEWSGVEYHRRTRTLQCKPCREFAITKDREAKAEAKRRRQEEGVLPKLRYPEEHGTQRGVGQHRTLGTQLCEPCRTWKMLKERERRANGKEQ